MTTTVFRRPPRIAPPAIPEVGVALRPAPELARREGGGVWMSALPAMSGLGSVAYMAAGPRSPITYVASSMFLLSSVAMVVGNLLRARSSASSIVRRTRLDYLRHLRRVRAEVRSVATAQRALARWRGPDPDQLWTITVGDRLWERRPADADFGAVRVGVGRQPLMTPLAPDDDRAPEELDPVAAHALRSFIATHAQVPGVPLTIAVRELAAVAVHGPPEQARALCRSMLVQAAAFHAPDDLRIALCVSDPDGADWSWAKWMPHAQRRDRHDDVGPVRLIADDLARLEDLLEDDLAGRGPFDPTATGAHRRQLLVVLDGGQALDVGHVVGGDRLLDPAGLDGVTVLDLDGVAGELVARHGTTLTVHQGRLGRRERDNDVGLGVADAVSVGLADALARHLARSRLDTGEDAERAGTDNTLPALLGIRDPGALELDRLQAPRNTGRRLRTPIGVDETGAALTLDIREAAQGGAGPHGLVIGATGSGKSELLRTLVLGMATTHGSDVLNLVLVDFKGGATFAGITDLPHVAAVITNLEADMSLVDRMREALSGELTRRQELLRGAGNLVSIHEYERARARAAGLEPLPSLWVVVDEFSELLAEKPDLVELFVRIGRLGRSLGVHLLLASQRIDEGRLRGLESHLSYRIVLRTFSESESRAVLGVPDAHRLPSAPGHGYLKADGDGLRRFRAAYVSGAYQRAAHGAQPTASPERLVRPFTAAHRRTVDGSSALRAGPAGDDPASGTVLSTMVAQLAGHGPPAHRVWLPPLDRPDTLDDLMHGLAVRPGRGFGADPATAPLSAPVGVIDLPFQQRREPYVIDLDGAGGHVAVVGGPRSGRSTALRTLVAALALRHTSEEVQFYCLDFGGGTLFGLAGLPHVGCVAGRGEGDLAHRMVAELSTLLERREAGFRRLGVDSIARYRQARRDGLVDDRHGDVLIVVDGWPVLRQEHEDLEASLVELASRGLTYGVHLVLSAGRWLDLRMGLRDIVGSKIELKLGDALDSEVDRRAQLTVPSNRPGRALTPHALHALIALPRVDSRHTTADLADGVAELVGSVARAWHGEPAPPVRLLPGRITLADRPPDLGRGELLLGAEGEHLGAVVLEPRQDPALVVLGDSGSGKTSLLRALAQQVRERQRPDEAKLVLIDYRRTMLGEFDGAGVLSYAADARHAADTVAGLVEGFRRRLPGPDVTPDLLRAGSWWTGPRVHVLVDDYELVCAGGSPLDPLVEFLPHARDIGLHLVVARHAGGAGRALADPLIGRMRELGQPAVVLSAQTDEGALLGVRPANRPPGRGVLVSRRHGAVPIQLVAAEPVTVAPRTDA